MFISWPIVLFRSERGFIVSAGERPLVISVH